MERLHGSSVTASLLNISCWNLSLLASSSAVVPWLWLFLSRSFWWSPWKTLCFSIWGLGNSEAFVCSRKVSPSGHIGRDLWDIWAAWLHCQKPLALRLYVTNVCQHMQQLFSSFSLSVNNMWNPIQGKYPYTAPPWTVSGSLSATLHPSNGSWYLSLLVTFNS